MAQIKVNKNERSWAIEMISQINVIVSNNDLLIKRAGGESTVSVDLKIRMFPDVILYGDKGLNSILQGWELKMPDVPITDSAFVNDAQRKARTLRLDSFVIWNFQYARFYVYNATNDTFEVASQWDNPCIQTRKDVEDKRKIWEKTLLKVLLKVNDYMQTHRLGSASCGEVISNSAIDMLINTYKYSVAEYLQRRAIEDSVIGANFEQWWVNVKLDYEFDENDMYVAYARNVILNWTYRILFAHLIKQRQNEAMLVDKINYDMSPVEADAIFKRITAKCDFYNIFAGIPYVGLLPSQVWAALVEFSIFLRDNGIDAISHSMLQNILECTVGRTKRDFNGQFTTPCVLARILAKMTVHNWLEDVLDPCCGTGTIPREIIRLKGDKIGISRAVATTWASDKYKTPLQVANLSMVSYDTINLANRLFQKDVFKLNVGDIVRIVNPTTGEMMEEKVPMFESICSNLPFVSSNTMSEENKQIAKQHANLLDGKSDLSYYIVIQLASLLKDGGYLGVIVSNSWLGTKAGEKFYHSVASMYDLKQVHISGKGRWFGNSDVVTTILILQKKTNTEDTENSTSFFVWKESLEDITSDSTIEQQIVNFALVNKVGDLSVMGQSIYTESQIEKLKALGLSYNALFHDVSWLLDIKDQLIPLKSLFKVVRGSRRGWDKLFFPKDDVDIEDVFLKPALFNAKTTITLLGEPDRKAFCCGEPLEVLKVSYPKAFKWVMQFAGMTNKIGKPLMESLKMPNVEWYEMKPNEVVQFFTMMNPDKRFFFGRFKTPTFINQRLIGLQIKKSIDEELCHALLNSLLVKFYVEAVGFGRGLGVLNMNKESIEKCYIFNPALLSVNSMEKIKEKFRVVLMKKIVSVEEELKDKDWIAFNQAVLASFGLDGYYLRISNSLLSMRKVRKAAVEVPKDKNVTKEIIMRKSDEEDRANIEMAAENRKVN